MNEMTNDELPKGWTRVPFSAVTVDPVQRVPSGTEHSTLPLGALRTIPVTIPTLPEQHEIGRRVEELFAFADRIEARLATAQKTVDRLTPAVLAKAFRGELVPQDPNDEPASALLARLRNTATTEPTKTTRGRIPKRP